MGGRRFDAEKPAAATIAAKEVSLAVSLGAERRSLVHLHAANRVDRHTLHARYLLEIADYFTPKNGPQTAIAMRLLRTSWATLAPSNRQGRW